MSPTDESNGTLSQFLPKTLITPTSTRTRRARSAAAKKQIKEKDCKRVFIFMDDCGYDSKSNFHLEGLKRLFYNGRHPRSASALHCNRHRHARCLSRELRHLHHRARRSSRTAKALQSSTLASSHEGVLHDNGRLHQGAYSALVSANNITHSNDICDSVFWYRRRPRRALRLGAKAVQELDRRCFDDVEARMEEKNKKSPTKKSEINRVVWATRTARAFTNADQCLNFGPLVDMFGRRVVHVGR